MKLLLYCTKNKPYVIKDSDVIENGDRGYILNWNWWLDRWKLNGKIIAECDYEVSEIELHQAYYNYGPAYFTKRKEPFKYFSYTDLLEASCFQDNEILKYLGNNGGYAIHIKNLHIFDKPKELEDTEYYNPKDNYKKITKRYKHNNNYMRIICLGEPYNPKKIFLPVHPEELCRILNGEQDIIIRKKVLKEML